MRNLNRNKGFTLVEILIVVVILGILAAIVVPQFTNATQDAQTGNIRAQLKSLQNQCELFKARTNAYPDLAADGWGTAESAPGAGDGTGLIGLGYIKAAPKNPHNGSALIGTDPAADGWTWDGINLGATNYDETLDRLTPGVE